jgi:LysR family transcriptional regulator, regulator for metE and metH
LSHQLREIEDQLGVSLFHRVGRRLTLAPAGDRILRAAKMVLPEIERAEIELGQGPTQILGTIRIAVDDENAYRWLPRILRRFGRTYPNIELRLVTPSEEKPLRGLRSNEHDLALISQPLREKQIKYYELFEDELVALVAAGHPLSGKKYLQANDFGNEILFCSGRLGASLLHQRVFRPAGIRPRALTEINLIESALELVKYDFGIAVLSRSAVQRYLAIGEIRALPITSHGLRRVWRAAIRAGKKPPETLTALVDALQRESMANVTDS